MVQQLQHMGTASGSFNLTLCRWWLRGLFWMSFEDFESIFSTIEACIKRRSQELPTKRQAEPLVHSALPRRLSKSWH